VFARSEEDRLYVARCTSPACECTSPTCEWSWKDLGGPPNSSSSSNPLALSGASFPIAYRDRRMSATPLWYSRGHWRINVLRIAQDDRLHMAWCTGEDCDGDQAWPWVNLGKYDNQTPLGASLGGLSSAITYYSGGKQRIYVFAFASGQGLVVKYFDGTD